MTLQKAITFKTCYEIEENTFILKTSSIVLSFLEFFLKTKDNVVLKSDKAVLIFWKYPIVQLWLSWQPTTQRNPSQ